MVGYTILFYDKRSGFYSEELLTDVFLKKVADELGTENYQLGVLPHVKRPFITRIETDHHRNTWRVTFEILMKWRQTSTNRSDAIAMVEELIVALTQLHLNDVAEVVRLGECRTGQ